MAYRRILLAADFSEHGEEVIQRALELATKYAAELGIIHVVENVPIMDSSYGPIVPFDIDLTDQMVEAARKRLAEIAESLAIPEDRRWVEIGSPKVEIIRVAKEWQADLIVIGSHGRHGFGLLLGSTAASVIHHAENDVLAVRLRR
ncbi:universal stress protein [Methylocaldum szegediense]|uniref:Universal stress protein n=1 Tax=Methylocaldum szegediense TaxID=73780 RepID=A0ABN8X4N7_9GAMM|nr:universal stress protein [Methylocaldum szegediense]CAI8831183.1 Universal stress protein A homolog 2 [Methylocaldum szegediense]